VALNAPVIAAGGWWKGNLDGSDVAQIQLLTDRDCSVGPLADARRESSLEAGAGEPYRPHLNYVSNLEEVVEGDLIVTSGMDGIYPKASRSGEWPR
jgi:rod shape-determining protein MreC